MKYKDLYKKIEISVRELDVSQDESGLIETVLDTVLSLYGDDLGILSGRLYIREGDIYRLIRQIGRSKLDIDQTELPSEYLPIRKLREEKYIIMHRNDSGIDSNLQQFMVADTFAAIALGDTNQYLASFSVSEPCEEEQLHFSLNTIRFVTNFKLRELSMQDVLLKAREIQLSLLPSYLVDRRGYEIYGKSIPADFVGGDAFDYLLISDDTLGIAVMDAVGHGLPAALQARDAVTGLRMGIESNIKMEFMISRLNRVMHRSNLSSRFVSLFYGELEENGNFIYINAGHPPALLFRSGGSVHELTRGGMVLGPNPTARYQRGFVFLNPGDILVVYSDGITEEGDGNGNRYGLERFREHINTRLNLSARDLTETVFQEIHSYSGKISPSDDQTLVIVKRTENLS
ncbi:serine/threonine-protein phosphatase [bacterium]|nr:serine/threonine-protein phosphatase [candidate division CSSED10-310 bacterium]